MTLAQLDQGSGRRRRRREHRRRPRSLRRPPGAARSTPSRADTVARSTIPAACSASSGIRSQPPRPITTAAPVAAPLLADAPVADVHDAVGDLRRARVVADDERRHALLARELGQELVDGGGARLVELAGRLVGDQQPRPVRERGAERDPLLLAAGELARVARLRGRAGRPARAARARARAARRSGMPCEPERHRDQLLGGQLAGERPPVVLVGVAERARRGRRRGRRRSGMPRSTPATDDACRRSAARARRARASASSCPSRSARARRRPRPPPPRASEPLQRGDPAVARRVDAEQVAGLDEAHVPISCARAGPRSSRERAPRREHDEHARRRRGRRRAPTRDDPQVERGRERRLAAPPRGRDGDDPRDEEREHGARDGPGDQPGDATTSARTRTTRRSSDGAAPWASRS